VFGAFSIVEVLPSNEPGFHCELEESAALVLGGLYGLIAIGLGVGVWFGQEWARWMCGIGGLLTVGFCLWSDLTMEGSIAARFAWPWRVENILFSLFLVLLTIVGIHCLRPSTGNLFAQAREARARARAVPG
jgi:hypothetical protein